MRMPNLLSLAAQMPGQKPPTDSPQDAPKRALLAAIKTVTKESEAKLGPFLPFLSMIPSTEVDGFITMVEAVAKEYRRIRSNEDGNHTNTG